MCNFSVAILKKHSVERHFQRNYRNFGTNYAINSEIRKKNVNILRAKVTYLEPVFTWPVVKSKIATITSFEIACAGEKKIMKMVSCSKR